MKKLSKIVFIFILGILVTISVNVAAETLISSEGVSYSNSKTSETTVDGALDELFSAIDISKQIGNITQISGIGDGTISGAISTLNSNLISTNNIISQLNSNLGTITDRNDNYIIIGNYGIAWGTVTLERYNASIYHYRINLPFSFVDTNYNIQLTGHMSMNFPFKGQVNIVPASIGNAYFTARSLSNSLFTEEIMSTNEIGCSWFVIGRISWFII